MPVIAVWTPADALLDIAIPLGLVAAVRSGLVVDLDPAGPNVGSGPTLAELVSEEPTAAQLAPVDGAAAYLSNGGVEPDAAWPVVAALVERWPATVLRCAPRGPRPDAAIAVLPLLPAPFTLRAEGRCVYQRTAVSPREAPAGPVLPRPRPETISSLLAGRRPATDRWLRSLRSLWEHA